MNDLKTAAQQALEFLDAEFGWSPGEAPRIDALRAALAQEQPTPAWWRDGLASTLMREGINKRRAREIADGYWQAYCKIGGNDD